MKTSWPIKDKLALLLAVVSVMLICAVLAFSGRPGDITDVADNVGRRVERRLDVLYSMVGNDRAKLPDDMVVYRYEEDSLVSWRNIFPVSNDDIGSKVMFQRMSDPRMSLRSPLADIKDSLVFVNLGPEWFLVRSYEDKGSKVIAGLEVVNTRTNTYYNGVNPYLHVGNRFSVKPLSESEGYEVTVDGNPMFKLCYDSLNGVSPVSDALVWISFGLLLMSGAVFLESRRSVKRFVISMACLLVLAVLMYAWGLHAGADLRIFSPLVFAGGGVLRSLGAVVIVNLVILMLTGGLFLVRKDLYERFHSRKSRFVVLVAGLLAILGILVYTHVALKSIILNSNICLELYKVGSLSIWSLVVYLSFLSMLMSVPLLLQLLQPACSRLLGHHVDVFSMKGRVILSSAIAVYLVVIAAILGFGKEQTRLGLWSGRLTVDRDISLEMELRRIGPQIAGDVFISSLSVLDNAESAIVNLLTDKYMSRLVQNYNIRVFVSNESTSPRRVAFVNERIKGGEHISENSHFLYMESQDGTPRYDGVFLYIDSKYGLSRVVVEVVPPSGTSSKGYMGIIGAAAPGKVIMPSIYAYARYRNGLMQTFKGNYAYPTRLNGIIEAADEPRILKSDGFIHFVNPVNEDEVVVVSRPVINSFNHVIAVVLIALILFAMMSLMVVTRRGRTGFSRSYFKTRISWVMMISLTLTLVVMATASVLFVYRRNNANLNAMMSDKIGSIQTMVQDAAKTIPNTRAPGFQEMMTLLETIAANTGSDITLYGVDGKFLMSTSVEAVSRMFIGSRIDETAFDNIIGRNRRYHIQKEKIGRHAYYGMYAPLMDGEGRMAAIISSPYTGDASYDFERDVVIHSMSIVALFLLLLILARFTALGMVERMFKPLAEMGRKMDKADIGTLERISYDRDDEVSTLVDAYNRMVTELSESTAKLAQAERDKAWSGMARQVAHEIKNPLTPMKLQLQRIMRLKQKGTADWQDKFDEVSRILLDHIDILTDTANEFSTFAKLYSEEPSAIDLDRMLQEEIAMFDNREGVTFEYRGFEKACVMGPKPQLTRVFVNLINNAVQAVEGSADGRIVVSLRKSSEEGFYDIVVEDNGPGVEDGNVPKLFSPNFTTKSAGSGLGLAISRSILEKCGATIVYSRSFLLGGACFTIRYPR